MKLKDLIDRIGDDCLTGLGFSRVTKWAFERQVDGLCHGIGFVKGNRSRMGQYTVDVFWRYTNSQLIAPEAMDCHRRIGDLLSGPDLWYDIDNQDPLARCAEAISHQAVPFLDEHRSIHDVMCSFENSRYTERVLFGHDAGWRSFHIGFCYLSIAKPDMAITFLKDVVELHSSATHEWVQERRRVASLGIAEATERLKTK